MPPRYEDFFLVVDGATGNYTVEAQGPGEIRVPPVPFVYQETTEVSAELERIKMGYAPAREKMQALGSLLFDALFPRKIIRAFESAPQILPPDVGLRVKLIVRPAELSHLPWELIYDPDEEVFLAARLSYPVVRFIESGKPVASLLAGRPLRVLYVHANPLGTEELNAQASERALREGLGAVGEVKSIHATTPEALRDALREAPGYHVLHYDGHAAFDTEGGEGFIYLHDEDDQEHPLSGEMLATFLDGTSVRLVVLSACETAMDSTQKRFSGIAHQLMRVTGLPAVIAMQYAIANSSAVVFTQGFYGALADDYPVDAATVEGRKAILAFLGGDAGAFAEPDWATPVLFMRSKDGSIFQEAVFEEETVQPATLDRGDIVHRDEVMGDRIGGDKIGVGDISDSTGVAIGRRARAVVSQREGRDETTGLFASVYQQIEARRYDPDVDNEELVATVQMIQDEVRKGDAANTRKVQRWLKTLAWMAGDVFEITAERLCHPNAGVADAIRRVAVQVKQERG